MKRKGGVKTVILWSVSALIFLGGATWVLNGSDAFERYQNAAFALLGPEFESARYLSQAADILAILRSPDLDPSRDVPLLVDEYSLALSAAEKAIEEIDDSRKKEEMYHEGFWQLAGEQQALRAIRRRPPYDPIDSIDVARYENMALQERMVKRIEALGDGKVQESSAALACPGCNVILISLTTLRSDRIGLYGYNRETTPNIDAFFSDALRFTKTLSPSAWTAPDAVSLLTGLFPYSHGIAIREPPSVSLLYNKEIKTMAQVLSERAYKTAAFTGGGDYNRRYNGLDRGFDFYLDEVNYDKFGISDDLSLGGLSLFYAPLRSFLGLAEDWLDDNSGGPFFLFLQGYDTHCPLEAREPYAERFTRELASDIDFSYCHWTYDETEPISENGTQYWVTKVVTEDPSLVDVRFSKADIEYMNALYDARVAEVDDRLGSFFKKIHELGLEKNTIVILMSEHGDMLGEHGWFMRGGALHGVTYEQALRFPLIIRHPRVHEPIVVDDIVQMVDIMPTLLSMLGIADPQAGIREGTPLRFSTFGEPATNEYGFAGALYIPTGANPLFSKVNMPEVIRDERWKLVKEILFKDEGFVAETVSYKLYDLVADPGEAVDVYEQEREIAQVLRKKLEEWSARYRITE